jgi:hypothetical protein
MVASFYQLAPTRLASSSMGELVKCAEHFLLKTATMAVFTQPAGVPMESR